MYEKKEEKRYEKKPEQKKSAKYDSSVTKVPIDSKYQDKKAYRLTPQGQASYNQQRMIRPEYVMINPLTMEYHTDPLLAMKNYVKSPEGAFDYTAKPAGYKAITSGKKAA